MLSINIVGLSPGVHDILLEPSAEDVELDPSAFRNVRVALHLERKPDQVFVMLDTSAVANLECDRTLAPFEQEVEGQYQVLFAPPEMATALENKEDIRLLEPDEEEIDITDVVRDTLLLAVPQRKVAPGAEDVDIPTRFPEPGAEPDDVDPRWAALRALRDDTSGDE